MTQRFLGSGNQRNIPGRASSAYTPLGPDDPEIIEEAKVLLAQFIKHSTQGTRASSETVTNRINGTSHDRAGRRTAASPSAPAGGQAVVNGWQATCAEPEDQNPTGASTKNPEPPQTRETPHSSLRRHTRGCEPGSSAEPPASEALPAARKRASSSMSKRARRTPNLPSKENSPGSDMVQPTGIRRSRRSRTGPANYYQIPTLSDFEKEDDHDYQDEDEEEEGPRSYQPARLASHLRRRDTSTPICILDRPVRSSPAVGSPGVRPTRDSMVYSSRTAQIIKSPFVAGETEKRLTRWPYFPGRKTVDSLKRLSRDRLQTGTILHVDFDHQEITALLALLSFYGAQPPSQPDTALADCAIQALSSPSLPFNLPKKLSRLCRLSRAAVEEGVADTKAWLTENLTSGNNKRSQKVRRLLCKALKIDAEGEEFTMPDGQLRPDIADKIYKLSRCLQHAFHLSKRERADIESFVADAREENVATVPYVFRVQPVSESPSTRKTTPRHGLSELMRQREMGGRAHREIQSNTAKNLGVTRTWKGASNDVIVAAWSPDGTRFAAGATAQCDEHNMEYNRGNNLVWGDLTTNVLTELPDHCIPRPPGRSSVSRTVNDARLFMSVSSMEWHDDALFTASYDNTVKLWDFPNNTARCFKTLRHDSRVEVMARSKFADNLLATGTNSIGLWHIRESRYQPLGLSGLRSQKELIPTSLAWGTIPATQNILLAGMSEKEEEGVSRNGFLAAWHVGQGIATPMHLLPNSQNIFDIKWHPTLPLFVTASAASLGGPRTHRDTRSVVRLYQPFPEEMRMRRTIEFECPALDINDVAICPSSSNYVTASCTDGVTYVWDSRRPDQILHRLRHGAPLNQIDELIDREQADVGVRMAIWGTGTDQFYTGASDGVLKLWDITRSPDDVLVQDVANLQEEIMSGAFSADKSNLLIGDAAGGIHVLSSGPFSQDEKRSFQFKRAQVSEDRPSAETGVAISREYTSTGRLVRHPIYGYGKGPNYDGPFASWARPVGTPSHELATTPLNEDSQIRQFEGPPLAYRTGLSAAERAEFERRLQLCRIRNQLRNVHKRKRESGGIRPKSDPGSSYSNFVDLCSDEEMDAEETKPPIAKAQYAPTHQDIEVIDLTGDTDSETVEAADIVKRVAVSKTKTKTGRLHFDELASLLEALEEDFWWPDNKDIDANLDDAD
ncbi:hypothetical protein HFD88_006960 [Aspergillus terreus]|nr:hypothetical protein HFD88_006960 [Aspergillus terreus]